LLRLRRIDVTGVDPRLAETEVVVASDVDNPLLGPSGAAEVYGPQKGASPADVEVLERGLGTLADCVEHQLGIDAKDRPGAGAAGGVGYGCMVFLHATLRPGIAFLLDLLRFPQTLDGAQLVVTGEGALDTQSLHGKAPVGVANAARAAGLPVIAVAGRSTLSAAQLAQAGFAAAYALSDLEPDPTLSMANAGELLHRVGQQIATDWLHRSEVVP
jgi:glycerate kinase